MKLPLNKYATMDNSHMDHGDMDHGHDGGMEDMCNMNVREHPSPPPLSNA